MVIRKLNITKNNNAEEIFKTTVQNKPQRQDSLTDHLIDLIPIAEQNGMYDAADYIKKIVGRK